MVWALASVAVRRRHGRVVALRAPLDGRTRDEVTRNVRALGGYANYAALAAGLSGVVSLFFSPLTSVVGHLCAQGDRARARESFDRLWSLSFVLGCVCFLGFAACANGMVALLFGPGLQVSWQVTYVIALNQMVSCLRRAPLLFRDASGTFYNDRWKPVVEGVVNLALSVLLVQVLPGEWRVAGVVLATVVTTLLVCHVVEPYVVFGHVFGESPRRFWVRMYACVGTVAVADAGFRRALLGLLADVLAAARSFVRR